MNKNIYFSFVAFSVLLVLFVQFEDVQAHKLLRSDVSGPGQVEASGGQAHPRQKRTIGHIFNMFRGFMSNMFGQNGPQRGKGRGRGRQRPSSGYGPPQSGYGAPQPGYNAPSQPSNPVALPSGGNVDSYGSPQAPAIDNYGSPQAPAIDSYGSPQAPAIDSYGSPQAPALEGYGSPQAPPVGSGNLDSYGSPQAPISGGGPLDTYGSSQSFNNAPRAPGGASLSSYGDVGSGFSQGSGLSDTVFKMLPAPNLATETPNSQQQQPSQDSYGSPQSGPLGPADIQEAPDSYGSPQGGVLSIGNSAPDSYGSPQGGVLSVGNGAPDSYGSPQGGVLSVGNGAPDSYGSPQTAVLSVSNNLGDGPAVIEARPAQNSYGSPQAGVVQPEVIAARPAQDAYGAPSNPFLTPTQPSLPIYDINPRVVNNFESSPQNSLDQYGPPVPQDIPIENYGSPDQPEGELVSTKVENEGPAFDNLRDNVGEKQIGSTEVPDLGVSDNEEGSTTTIDPVFPGYEDVDYDQNNYQYDDSDIKSAPGLPGYGNQAVTLPLRVPGRQPANQKNNLGTYQVKAEPVDNNSLETDKEAEDADADADEDEDANGQVEDEQSKYVKNETLENDSNQLAQTEEYPELEDPEIVDSTTEAAFISVPLLIEEVNDEESGEVSRPGDPTVILAGSPEDPKKPDVEYGAPGSARKGRENDSGHQFLVDVPNAKRQADWSQRIREKQRQRVWRQFQLD